MCTRKSVCVHAQECVCARVHDCVCVGVCTGDCVCVCVVRPFLSLDQNLAWHMLPTTAVMKEVGTTFIVGKIRTRIDRDVLHMSTNKTMVLIRWTRL